jgi:hypothetical protein
MSIHVAVLVIRWIYVTPSAMQEILADIGGKRGHPGSCALEALANVQEGCVGTSGLGSGGVAVSPVVTSVAGRNNCGCLDDLFYLCTGVADALGNSG